MPTLALSFVMGAALWIWFKSAPTHSDLGRIGGAGKSERCCHSWPECWPCHGLTPFLCFCFSQLPGMTFLLVLVLFFKNVSLRIAVFTWYMLYLSFPSPVCAMAVRNCLECQQAQFKQGKEGTAQTYTALPANALGTSKSASAQASHPSSPPPPQHIYLKLNENVRLNSFTFWWPVGALSLSSSSSQVLLH